MKLDCLISELKGRVFLTEILQNMTKAFTFIVFLIFISCAKKKTDNIYFTLNAKDLKNKTFHKGFYGYYNFLLLDSSKIVYHNKHHFNWCVTGLDISKPPKINLDTADLKYISLNELTELLKSIPDSVKDDVYLFASISTISDTIRNRGFKTLENYFNKNGIVKFSIRKPTEEEEYVLYSKIHKTKYEPERIIWKEGFDTDWMDSVARSRK